MTLTRVLECVEAAPTIAHLLPKLLVLLLLTEAARYTIVRLPLHLLQWVMSKVATISQEKCPGWVRRSHVMIMDVLLKVMDSQNA